ISNNYLNLLTKHYKTNGVCLPKPKTGGRRFNKTALSTEDITRIVTFITSYGELHGLPLPGRQSRVNTNDPRTRLLPSSENKSTVFRKYEKEMEEVNRRKTAAGQPLLRIARRSTFNKLWLTYAPYVMISRPKSDLCWTCQANNASVYRSANESEAEKMTRLQCQASESRGYGKTAIQGDGGKLKGCTKKYWREIGTY
ncbi:uncharacterized protein LOC117117326, partial [Anneissia japonica]|uniref:uncharacterized protein LOC117117326 n=1 Tax=Anneissia japonica TaxID=1529436 RepID=UPI0014254E54